METPNVGIDIGTTTSALATVSDGSPRSIEEWVSVPTVVSFEAGHAVVGESARARAIRDPIRTVRSFPRLLGTGERVSVVVDGQTREYTPEELTALVLTKLRQAAQATGTEGVVSDRGVLTVPTTFTARQRRALCQACAVAGIDIVRLMTGPTAAALAHGIRTETDGTILVYDLGWGFDAALIDVTEGVFDVLGTDGDPWLGGAAFDATIVEWLDLHLERKHGIDLKDDPFATEQLFAAARTAKHALISHRSTTITATLEHTGDRYEIRQPLHRNQLERRTRDLVSQTISVCEDLLETTGRREQQVDRLLFVGGETDLPFVRERVTDRFEYADDRRATAETTALGGAMRAAIVNESPATPTSASSTRSIPTETVVLDATPHSLCLAPTAESEGRLVSNNATLPRRATATFTTTTDRQQYLVVPVYHDYVSESPRTKRNHQTEPNRTTDRTTTDRSMDDTATTTSERTDGQQVTRRLLDAFRIGPLRPRRAGDPSIEVTFEFDPNGIVRAHATDLDAERDGTLEATAVYRHTETEIETMKHELPTVR